MPVVSSGQWVLWGMIRSAGNGGFMAMLRLPMSAYRPSLRAGCWAFRGARADEGEFQSCLSKRSRDRQPLVGAITLSHNQARATARALALALPRLAISAFHKLSPLLSALCLMSE